MPNIYDQFDEKPDQNIDLGFSIPPEQASQAPQLLGGFGIPGAIASTPFGQNIAKTMFGGMVEPTMAIGSSMIAEPIAGLRGIANLPGGVDQATNAINKTRQSLTQLPQSEIGRNTLGSIGEALTPIGDAFSSLSGMTGDALYNMSGSQRALMASATLNPLLMDKEIAGAYGESLPALASEFLGAGIARSAGVISRLNKVVNDINPGTRLIIDGEPTAALRKALNKQGLTFENLTPEAKSVIPDTAKKGLIKSDINSPSEQALIEQIKSGATDDSLADVMIKNGKVQPDKVAKEAINQGFEKGLIQSIKASNPETKGKMIEMVKRMRSAKQNMRRSLDFRPSDVVGDSVTSRISFIRDRANAAAVELDTIAKTKLRGKPINTESVINRLFDSTEDLDIRFSYEDGIPKPIYEGSLISKDRVSQKAINDMIDLLTEDRAPDALRAHKLKRQLDIIIDFNKKSSEGLSDAGRNVLKDVRSAMNDAVRVVDEDYARVNDTLSQSLDALGSLDKALGTIDPFAKNADKAIGTRMRALLSNQQGRQKIENSLDQINDVVSSLGGKFNDDIKQLVLFSDALDQRFGTLAKTSLAGDVAKATQGIPSGARDFAIDKARRAAEKASKRVRRVNDFNSYESLMKLLERK